MEYTLLSGSFNPFTTIHDAKMPTSLTMRETLVKGEQLTDENIHLSQRLLKKHFHQRVGRLGSSHFDLNLKNTPRVHVGQV